MPTKTWQELLAVAESAYDQSNDGERSTEGQVAIRAANKAYHSAAGAVAAGFQGMANEALGAAERAMKAGLMTDGSRAWHFRKNVDYGALRARVAITAMQAAAIARSTAIEVDHAVLEKTKGKKIETLDEELRELRIAVGRMRDSPTD